MKSTAARTTRSTRPTLVSATPAKLPATFQDPDVVGTGPDYAVVARNTVQLEDDEGNEGKPEPRWMTWVASVTYDTGNNGGANVRLSAEQTEFEWAPPRTNSADLTHAIGILSIEEFRAVVAGLGALAATLPTESPFARAVAAERGE